VSRASFTISDLSVQRSALSLLVSWPHFTGIMLACTGLVVTARELLSSGPLSSVSGCLLA
jgi:hypothetical protein